jgi:hypothetical protein
MNDRAASHAVSKIATPKNGAASCGVFTIPRKRDKPPRTLDTASATRPPSFRKLDGKAIPFREEF